MVPRLALSPAFRSYDLQKPSIWPPLTDVVRRWLAECTMIESESNVQMNVICLIWLQLAFLIIHERAPLVILKVVFSFSFFSLNPRFSSLLLCFRLVGHTRLPYFRLFARNVNLYLTIWLAEARQSGTLLTLLRIYISQLWQIQASSFYSTMHLYCLCAA